MEYEYGIRADGRLVRQAYREEIGQADTSTPATYRAAVLRALLTCRERGHDPTLQDIARMIGHPYAVNTVGAKLRELRNPDYGPPRKRGQKPRGYEIPCWRSTHEGARLPRGTKIYRYRLVR